MVSCNTHPTSVASPDQTENVSLSLDNGNGNGFDYDQQDLRTMPQVNSRTPEMDSSLSPMHFESCVHNDNSLERLSLLSPELYSPNLLSMDCIAQKAKVVDHIGAGLFDVSVRVVSNVRDVSPCSRPNSVSSSSGEKMEFEVSSQYEMNGDCPFDIGLVAQGNIDMSSREARNIERHISETIVQRYDMIDAVSKMNLLCQQNRWPIVNEAYTDTRGPSHDREFIMGYTFGIWYSEARGKTKKVAKATAFRRLLAFIEHYNVKDPMVSLKVEANDVTGSSSNQSMLEQLNIQVPKKNAKVTFASQDMVRNISSIDAWMAEKEQFEDAKRRPKPIIVKKQAGPAMMNANITINSGCLQPDIQPTTSRRKAPRKIQQTRNLTPPSSENQMEMFAKMEAANDIWVNNYEPISEERFFDGEESYRDGWAEYHWCCDLKCFYIAENQVGKRDNRKPNKYKKSVCHKCMSWDVCRCQCLTHMVDKARKVKRWCCEFNCFPVPTGTLSDGIACDDCESYSFCRCACLTTKYEMAKKQRDRQFEPRTKFRKELNQSKMWARCASEEKDLKVINLKYNTFQKRVKSFDSESYKLMNGKLRHFSPGVFANAGFYFKETEPHRDSVVCYSCGLGLENFDPEDDIISEHIQYNPKCEHLLRVVSRSFVYEEDKRRQKKATVGLMSQGDHRFDSEHLFDDGFVAQGDHRFDSEHLFDDGFVAQGDIQMDTSDNEMTDDQEEMEDEILDTEDMDDQVSQDDTEEETEAMETNYETAPDYDERYALKCNYKRCSVLQHPIPSVFDANREVETSLALKEEQTCFNKAIKIYDSAWKDEVFVAQGLFDGTELGKAASSIKEASEVTKSTLLTMGQKINETSDNFDVVTKLAKNTFDNINTVTVDAARACGEAETTFKRLNDSSLMNRFTNAISSIENMCNKASGVIDKTSGVFDQITQVFQPGSVPFKKAVLLASVTKLFISAPTTLTTILAYCGAICAIFDMATNAFASVYAKVKDGVEEFMGGFRAQGGDDEEDIEDDDELTEKFTLFGSIAETFAAILGVKLTLTETMKKLSECGRAIVGGEKIYKIITHLFSWVRDKYCTWKHGLTYEQYKIQVDTPEICHIAKCVIMLENVTNQEIDSCKELCEQIIAIDRNLVSILACISNSTPTFPYLTNLRNAIRPKVAAAENASVMTNSSRTLPYSIYLYGLSGTGKTNLSALIRAKIYERYLLDTHEPGWAKSTFPRNVKNEYWDGYNEHPIIQYDDIFQLFDSATRPNDEMMEILRVMNDNTYHLHMASVSDKKNYYCKAEFVIASSNVRAPAVKSMHSAMALYRRFDTSVEVSILPKYGKQSMNEGKPYYQVDDTKMETALDEHIYQLKIYEMGDQGSVEIEFPPEEGKTSLDKLMDHLFKKIDAHRVKKTDRADILARIAGGKRVVASSKSAKLAADMKKLRSHMPSTDDVKTIMGKKNIGLKSDISYLEKIKDPSSFVDSAKQIFNRVIDELEEIKQTSSSSEGSRTLQTEDGKEIALTPLLAEEKMNKAVVSYRKLLKNEKSYCPSPQSSEDEEEIEEEKEQQEEVSDEYVTAEEEQTESKTEEVKEEQQNEVPREKVVLKQRKSYDDVRARRSQVYRKSIGAGIDLEAEKIQNTIIPKAPKVAKTKEGDIKLDDLKSQGEGEEEAGTSQQTDDDRESLLEQEKLSYDDDGTVVHFEAYKARPLGPNGKVLPEKSEVEGAQEVLRTADPVANPNLVLVEAKENVSRTYREMRWTVSKLCQETVEYVKPSAFNFPSVEVSSRWSKIVDKMKEVKEAIYNHPKIKAFIDKALESMNVIITGIIGVISVGIASMAGYKLISKGVRLYKGCPLRKIKSLAQLFSPTSCKCKSCDKVRLIQENVTDFDSVKSVSDLVYEEIKNEGSDTVLIAHMDKLRKLTSKLDKARTTDYMRELMISKRSGVLKASDETVIARNLGIRLHDNGGLAAESNTTKSLGATSKSKAALIAESKSMTTLKNQKAARLYIEGDRILVNQSERSMVEEAVDLEQSEKALDILGPHKNVLKKDQSFHEQHDKVIGQSCIRITAKYKINGKKCTMSTGAFFITGRTVMLPFHLLQKIISSDEQVFDIQLPYRTVKEEFRLKECTWMQMTDFMGGKVDAALMTLGKTSARPTIIKFFPIAKEINKMCEGDLVLAGLRMSNERPVEVNIMVKGTVISNVIHRGDDGTENTTYVSIVYNSTTRAGDCGSLLFCRHSGMSGRIVGMHLAGSGTSGMSVSCSREFINRNMADFSKIVNDTRMFVSSDLHAQCNVETIDFSPLKSLEQLDVEGNYLNIGVTKKVNRPVKTNLSPSTIHNKIYPTLTKPAHLVPIYVSGIKRDPLMEGIRKSLTVQAHVDHDIMKIAANDVLQQLPHRVGEMRRLLTYEESIQGIEGDENVCGMDRSTSPGHPWYYNKNYTGGKRLWMGTGDEWVTDNVELKTAVMNVIDKAKRNIRAITIFTSTLKDERRPKEKVDQVKTRVFEAGPMHYTVAMRKYFMAFVAELKKGRIHNECGVGTNPYSIDWHILATVLQSKGKDVIAGDFKGYDGSLHQDILWEVCNIINAWYDDCAENQLVRKVLFEEIVNSYVMVDGAIIQKTHSQPSGNPLTVVINSLFNQIVMRMAYLIAKEKEGLGLMCDFTKNVAMVAYGDDNVLNISPKILDWYNQVTITEHLATFGLVYTDEAKTGVCVPSRTLDQINFLKRKFRKTETGIYVGPLLMETVRDMSNWVRGKEIRQATIANVDEELKELALHGREIYNDEAAKIRKALKEVDLSTRIPCFEEWSNFFEQQRKQV